MSVNKEKYNSNRCTAYSLRSSYEFIQYFRALSNVYLANFTQWQIIGKKCFRLWTLLYKNTDLCK